MMRTNRYKIFLIPFITLLVMVASMLLMLVLGVRNLEQLESFALGKIGYVLGNAFLSVSLFYIAVNWFNRWVSWSKNWISRLLLDGLLVMAYSFLMVFLMKYATQLGWHPRHEVAEVKEIMFVIPLMANTLFLVMIELILAVEERDKLALQVTQMEKEQINTKYGALKEQLDHHFLFNNLSVLSSLIYEDVEKADRFIQDFAAIYRYVLQINQRFLVTVQEELDFIETYLHLYKFRFEEGFSYVVLKDGERTHWMIPPLTLQVLVENAIKHNMTSRQHPLHLEISFENNFLMVKNTLQPKTDGDISTQKGQLNLVEKYRLLGKVLPEFIVEGDCYLVKIPLIEPNED
jgi:sensor histidine kinase YesM